MYRNIVLCWVFVSMAFIASNATLTTVNLPKCVNFTRDRNAATTSNILNLTNYPRENPDEEPPLYILTGNVDLEKTGACNKIEIWTVLSHSPNLPSVQSWGIGHVKYTSNIFRDGGYITRDGRFFDGIFYHNQTNFCIHRTTSLFGKNNATESAFDWYVRIKVCQHSSDQAEAERAASCVKKCCASNKVIDYSSGLCRRLTPTEPEWTPQVCEGSGCVYKNVFCGKSHLLGLDEGDRVQICKGKVKKIPFTYNVQLESGFGKMELMYLSRENQWKRFGHQYCMDGFVSDGKGKYENKKTHQAIMICEEHDPGISDQKSSAQILHALGLNVLLFIWLKAFVLCAYIIKI